MLATITTNNDQISLIFLTSSGYSWVDYHIWKCTLDPKNVFQCHYQQWEPAPNFSNFSDILLLFHLKMHGRTHNSILVSCSFLWTKHMFMYTHSLYYMIYLNRNFIFSLHFISLNQDLMLVSCSFFFKKVCFCPHAPYYIIYLDKFYSIMFPEILHFFCILFHLNWHWFGKVTQWSHVTFTPQTEQND